MKIVSLVLKSLPARVESVKAAIAAIPGARVALDLGEGRLVAVVEDGDGYAVSDSILQIHRVTDIMSVTLSYEYSDEGLAPEEAPQCQ